MAQDVCILVNADDRARLAAIADLQAAINRYLREHNEDPKPFVWTKSADKIFAKLQQLPAPSQ